MFRTLKSTAVKVKVQSNVQTLPWKLNWQKVNQDWGPVFLLLKVPCSLHLPPSPLCTGTTQCDGPQLAPGVQGLHVCVCVFLARAEKDGVRVRALMLTDRAHEPDQGSSRSRCRGPFPPKFKGSSSLCSKRGLSYSPVLSCILRTLCIFIRTICNLCMDQP